MGKNGKLGKSKVLKYEVPKPKARESAPLPVPEHAIPVELQQLLLDIFKDTFPDRVKFSKLSSLLQEVKAALYERDFKLAFSKDEYLEAYTVRWSPSRALCYASVLADLRGHIDTIPRQVIDKQPETQRQPQEHSLRVVAFGGGAAEVVAFGGFLRHMSDARSLKVSNEALDGSQNVDGGMDLCLVDSAAWGDVVHKLEAGLKTPPPLSKYARQITKDANEPLIASSLQTTFHLRNVLEMGREQLSNIFGPTPLLVTLLFTLNELYTTSIGKTTSFLLDLTSVIETGSLLLVVDSPGSYSETMVGAQEKKYPMRWLMEHTLLDDGKGKGVSRWEIVISEDSQWYRLPDNLRYPIQLENMRYQMHLYRRI